VINLAVVPAGVVPGKQASLGEVGSSSSREGCRQELGVPLHGHEYVGHRRRKHHRSVWW
jgi:hypothetical protein